MQTRRECLWGCILGLIFALIDCFWCQLDCPIKAKIFLAQVTLHRIRLASLKVMRSGASRFDGQSQEWQAWGKNLSEMNFTRDFPFDRCLCPLSGFCFQVKRILSFSSCLCLQRMKCLEGSTRPDARSTIRLLFSVPNMLYYPAYFWARLLFVVCTYLIDKWGTWWGTCLILHLDILCVLPRNSFNLGPSSLFKLLVTSVPTWPYIVSGIFKTPCCDSKQLYWWLQRLSVAAWVARSAITWFW